MKVKAIPKLSTWTTWMEEQLHYVFTTKIHNNEMLITVYVIAI